MPAFARETAKMSHSTICNNSGQGNQEGLLEILPGKGLGSLRFRMPEADIVKILGPPEEIVEFDTESHLYYHSIGIFLFFGGDVAGYLSGIEVNARCRCAFAGEDIFPSNRDRVIRLLRAVSGSFDCYDAAVIYLEDEGRSRMTIKELGMDFYFSTKGLLLSVNWSE
jgi:hypothetical protein